MDEATAPANLTNHADAIYVDADSAQRGLDDVHRLLASPGWSRVEEILELELVAIDKRLDCPREPLSRAQYAMEHGRRSGIKATLQVPLAIIERAGRRLDIERAKFEGDAESSPGR
jgi:hypothetical protein